MTEPTGRTAVVALTADLMFAAKISGNARALQVSCAITQDPKNFLDHVRRDSPHLVLVDFSHPADDWESLLTQVRGLLDPYKGNLTAFTTHVDWKSTRLYHPLCHRVLTQEALVRELPTLMKSALSAAGSSPGHRVEVLEFETLRNELEPLSPEIARRVCFRGERYESGLISFRPQSQPDPKQIIHADKDVVCHVLSGQGRLRLSRGARTEMISLNAGTVVRIPPGIAHDFAAIGPQELMIWYLLITTTGPASSSTGTCLAP